MNDENSKWRSICEKRERDRERHWRNTPQGRFESSFVRIGDDMQFESVMSDQCRGVEAIVSACDREACDAERERRRKAAERMLRRRKCAFAIPVLRLVIENGEDGREESIACLMK